MGASKFRTIVLGIGHAPDGKTQYDVTLHLDHPRQPISMGERWGLQSIGAGYTLQEATELKWDAHLRACGCEWLFILASEERFRDRPFTPDEILARRPQPEKVARAEPPSAPAPAVTPEVLQRAKAAIRAADYGAIESLRDEISVDAARLIVRDWHSGLPWRTKDAMVALLTDQLDDCVMPMMRDALRSPTVESRACAVCVLSRDFARFDALMDARGVLDQAKVDAAVRELSAGLPPGR